MDVVPSPKVQLREAMLPSLSVELSVELDSRIRQAFDDTREDRELYRRGSGT